MYLDAEHGNVKCSTQHTIETEDELGSRDLAIAALACFVVAACRGSSHSIG